MIRALVVTILVYILVSKETNIGTFKRLSVNRYISRVLKMKELETPAIHQKSFIHDSLLILTMPIQQKLRLERYEQHKLMHMLKRMLHQSGLTMCPIIFLLNHSIITLILIVVCNLYRNLFSIDISFFMTSFLTVFAYVVILRTHILVNISKRQNTMMNQLPYVLDILSISITAGLSFDQALRYLVIKTDGPLIEEFRYVQDTCALGVSRKRALINMGERTGLQEIKQFISAITQAEEIGISLKKILDAQSNMVRTQMRQKTEERAAKIPVKILIPMVLFIFPVIFIILLGPAVPRVLEALRGL